MPRLDTMKAKGTVVAMPPLGEERYLVDYLWEAGPAMTGGMGMAPLTWTEIADWQRLTGTPLEPWEARMLRNLSADYVTARSAARDQACPAPYSTTPTESRRETISRGLRSMLSGWGKGSRPSQSTQH